MKLGLIQMRVSADKEENLNKAVQEINRAAAQGAELICLPEMFLCPYDNQAFSLYAEAAGGHVWSVLSETARQNRIILVAGSFPEKADGHLYNTCFVFGEDGRQIGFHRKAHLFDIDIEGGQRFMESAVLAPGNQAEVIVSGPLTFGVCICFDLRFPELAMSLALKGAMLLVVPAAFNMTTGPLHWELLFRQRAVDNQLFTVGIAPARDEAAGYVSFANSLVVSPWGEVIHNSGIGETTDIVEIDLKQIPTVRKQLPLLSARRPELYEECRAAAKGHF